MNQKIEIASPQMAQRTPITLPRDSCTRRMPTIDHPIDSNNASAANIGGVILNTAIARGKVINGDAVSETTNADTAILLVRTDGGVLE